MRAFDKAVFIRWDVEMHRMVIRLRHFAKFIVAVKPGQTKNQCAARAGHITSCQNIFRLTGA